MEETVPVQETGISQDVLRFHLFPVTRVEHTICYLDSKTEVTRQISFCRSPSSFFVFSCLFLLDTAYWKHWQKTFCLARSPARIAGGYQCQFCPWGRGGGQPESCLQIQWVWKIPFVYRGPRQSGQPIVVTLWTTGPRRECSQQHGFRDQPREGRAIMVFDTCRNGTGIQCQRCPRGGGPTVQRSLKELIQ